MYTSVQAVRTVVALFREFEQYARRGPLTMPQYRMLLFLMHGPKRAGELAALAEVKKPTVTPIIAALDARGLIQRVAVAGDRRSARLSITEEGQRVVSAFEQHLAERLSRYVDPDQRDAVFNALGGVLMQLVSNTEDRFQDMEAELLDAPKVEAQSS